MHYKVSTTLLSFSKKLWNMKTSHNCLFFLWLAEKRSLVLLCRKLFLCTSNSELFTFFQVYIKHAIHMKDLRGRNTGLAEAGLVDWMSASHGTGATSLTANYLPHVCTSEF